jgi:hypothetical protein
VPKRKWQLLNIRELNLLTKAATFKLQWRVNFFSTFRYKNFCFQVFGGIFLLHDLGNTRNEIYKAKNSRRSSGTDRINAVFPKQVVCE